MKKQNEMPSVQLYSDGACSGNPGVGGFGTILRSGEKNVELSGCEQLTTNNRMEMMAVIAGLEALKKPCKVKITTDSIYVLKGMTEWIKGWQRNNWKNSQRKDVLNRDLWERLLQATAVHQIEWEWIKGHNGHIENERCDLLAREAINKCRKGL
jgi:ribonuclease HI